MKFCPNCRLAFDDDAHVCSQCGNPLVDVPNQHDSTDHTAEFDPRDISDNKILAMLPYILGWVGIIITLLASGRSPYAFFHVKQALKIRITGLLSNLLLIIPIIGWIAAGIIAVILFVVDLVCFVRVCQNKAIEPPLVSGLKFLK